MYDLIARSQEYVRTRLWLGEDRPAKLALRLVVLALQGLVRHRSYLTAASLAYVTILALIPLLALLFAILKSLGIQRLLAAHLMDRLSPGSHEFALQILEYVEGTQVASLGVFGVIWLLAALILLMSDVEAAFNTTWQVSRIRPWSRRLSDYLSIFLLLPLLMAVGLSVTSGLLSQPDLRRFLSSFMPEALFGITSSLLSLGLLWVAFTFIYLVMPNTRVRFPAALLGGILGGTLWQGAHAVFAWFQGMATYYNAIYGALHHLLFLVMWIFWSWLVVLFGNEIACACQHLSRLSAARRIAGAEPEPVDEYLALTALLLICRPYLAREALLTRQEVELTLAAGPEEEGRRAVAALVDCGLVLEANGHLGDGVLVPAIPPEQLLVGEVLARVGRGRAGQLARLAEEAPQVAAALRFLREKSWPRDLARLSLKDLLLPPGPPA
ncbi:MAG: YihY/virulence factor BrkB family protein [Syntrophobacterales bacterium]|nr:YihY/virulence factor BrkB family protein [Syntrophobacterales bacterium]